MSSSISWKWSTIFNTTNLKSISNKCSDSSVTTLSVYLLTTSTISSYLDIQCSDTTSFNYIYKFLSSLHSSICTWFILTSFNHLTTRYSTNSFSTWNISNMNKCIILTSKYMSCSKNLFIISILWKICSFILNFLYCSCH